jgi:hypothetical protein
VSPFVFVFVFFDASAILLLKENKRKICETKECKRPLHLDEDLAYLNYSPFERICQL